MLPLSKYVQAETPFWHIAHREVIILVDQIARNICFCIFSGDDTQKNSSGHE